MPREAPETLLEARPKWWLVGSSGQTFGPFWKRQIATRFARYRIYRRFSEASRSACRAKAAENPFQGEGRRVA